MHDLDCDTSHTRRKVMRIAVGSDHAGVAIRQAVVESLRAEGHEVEEYGPSSSTHRTDYPDEAAVVAARVSRGEIDRGVLICGTGIGMSIVANKFHGVRAALVVNEFMAEYAVRHNNANVLVLPGRILCPEYAVRLVKVWLAASFDSGRHLQRIEKIEKIEAQNFKKLEGKNT